MLKSVRWYLKRSIPVAAAGFMILVSHLHLEASEISLDVLSTKAKEAGIDPQKDFELISRDIGRAIFINPANSPEPLGILGFNAGVEVLFLKVDSTPFERASGQSVPGSVLPVPRLRVQKGLPWGVDIGLAYLPEANRVNVGMFGGEIRVDLLEKLPLPTPLLHLSGRVSYSRLSGVDNLKTETLGFDLSGGVNFPFIKPYAGLGTFRTRSSVNNLDSLGLKSVDIDKGFFFAGVKLSIIPFVPFNIEYSNSTLSSISLKAGLEF